MQQEAFKSRQSIVAGTVWLIRCRIDLLRAVARAALLLAMASPMAGCGQEGSDDDAEMARCAPLPVFGAGPAISENPDVAAIQGFNRLLVNPGATADDLVPFVSQAYQYAGENHDAFVRDQVPDMVGFPKYFELCSIGLIEEDIRVTGTKATSRIVIGQSGTLTLAPFAIPAGLPSDAVPPLARVDRFADQYDFVKEGGGQWRFVAVRTVIGGVTEIGGGSPPLSVEATITPETEFAPGQRLSVTGRIAGASATLVQLLWEANGFDGQRSAARGEGLNATVQFGNASTRLPAGTDSVDLIVIGGFAVPGEQKLRSIVLKDFVIPAPAAPAGR